MTDVAILTEAAYLPPPGEEPWLCQIHLEEALVARALRAAGLGCARVAWDDPAADWSSFGALLFRTTWDYFNRFDQFSPWLDRVAAQARLFNSAATLRWNLDKHYLRDLAGRGVATVPTDYAERGSGADLAAVLDARGWSEAVFKPVVSGGARLTFRVQRGQLGALAERFAACVAAEGMMVQPFMETVLAQGELSLVVIDGQCTHAVRKVPRPGDFRVQDDHGGHVVAHEPSAEERRFAEEAIAACPETPLYARVDAVRDAAGRLCIMELELVEPELFLRFFTPAADRLAAGLRRRLRG